MQESKNGGDAANVQPDVVIYLQRMIIFAGARSMLHIAANLLPSFVILLQQPISNARHQKPIPAPGDPNRVAQQKQLHPE
jgi:hypothetical protein